MYLRTQPKTKAKQGYLQKHPKKHSILVNRQFTIYFLSNGFGIRNKEKPSAFWCIYNFLRKRLRLLTKPGLLRSQNIRILFFFFNCAKIVLIMYHVFNRSAGPDITICYNLNKKPSLNKVFPFFTILQAGPWFCKFHLIWRKRLNLKNFSSPLKK